jgi:hypothetical protein
LTDAPAGLVRGDWESGESGSGPLVERLLRQPESVWRQIAAERDLGRLNRQLVLTSWVPLSIYGVVLGASNSLPQALASAVKLPVLFLLTLAICLPALYLFNLVFGSRLSALQTLAIVSSAIATTSVLTLGFAPIAVFFLLSAPGYGFFKLLNVGVLGVTGLAGLKVLLSGMQKVQRSAVSLQVSSQMPSPEAPGPLPVSNRLLLRGWLVLYAFVGTQLAWTLRPFFGAPELPFELFRKLEGNFYVNIFQTLFG